MISVQQGDFDLGLEYDALRVEAGDPGAIVTFTGLVRELYDVSGGTEETVSSLFLEHYPGMTEQCLEDTVNQAKKRWPLLAAKVIHRVGELKPKDQIVFVGTASAHRHAAFESAAFIMDYLKSNAPFWKRQKSGERSEWISSRQSDEDALQKWNKGN